MRMDAALARVISLGLVSLGLLCVALVLSAPGRCEERPPDKADHAGRPRDAVDRAGRPRDVVDRVVVSKSRRLLQLLKAGEVIRQYRIALGANPFGPKVREGDDRTPEGDYVLDWRNARSKFHRSLHISYPSSSDRMNAARLGFSPGGAIMIHGLPNGMGWIGSLHIVKDWTKGCIAVTDQEIEEIWDLVPDGTPIHIES